jgi:hypothetical protein
MSIDSYQNEDFFEYSEDEFDDYPEEEEEEPAMGPVGRYSPTSRKEKIDRFVEKRRRRIWRKRIKYDVRKNFADSRLRVKGRFVRKEDEEQLREYLLVT